MNKTEEKKNEEGKENKANEASEHERAKDDKIWPTQYWGNFTRLRRYLAINIYLG